MSNSRNILQVQLQRYAADNEMTMKQAREELATLLNVAISTIYSYTRQSFVQMPVESIRKVAQFYEIDEKKLLDFYYPVEEPANA